MSDALQQQYAAIERLYSQGQWQQVLAAIDAIQDALPTQPGDPLRARVVLLQAHTLLYGLGQVEQAAAIYRQVLTGNPEAVLANIAQQELARCDELLSAKSAPAGSEAAPETTPSSAQVSQTPSAPQASVGSGAAFPFTAEAVGAPPEQQQAAAMPWLDALGGVDPGATQLQEPQANQAPWLKATDVVAAVAAEVIEEPEQLEVQQADPKRASVVDLEPLEEPEEPEQPTATESSAPAAAAATAKASSAEPEPQVERRARWSPAEEAELARGLLTVVLR